MGVAVLLYAFSAGMVATINPCAFAMLPAYVSYYLATGHGSGPTLSRSNPGGLQPTLEPNPVRLCFSPPLQEA